MDETYSTENLTDRIAQTLGWSQAGSYDFYAALKRMENHDAQDCFTIKRVLNELMDASVKNCYVACIKSSCISGVYKTNNSNAFDKTGAVPADGKRLFLEIIQEETPVKAARLAAKHAGVDPNVITLVPIQSPMGQKARKEPWL